MALPHSLSSASLAAGDTVEYLASPGLIRSRYPRPRSKFRFLRRAVIRAQQLQTASPAERFDVSNSCVQPVFRSIPNASEKHTGGDRIKVLFLSESNMCRSVYAEAIFKKLVKDKEVQDVIECTSKGTRDYNTGDKPDGNVLEVAKDLGLDIKDHSATVFKCERDVVLYDLLLVMDKFTASDVLKDVTIYETIDKNTKYCWKVRRLGEFCLDRKIEDIDDPLYGNTGGEEEMVIAHRLLLQEHVELHRVALDIYDSCNGLVSFLSDILTNLEDKENLKEVLAHKMGSMTPTEWVRPPMLSK
ncbi:hypothetical protein KP509_29G022500 [Ceratopteris richardii]|uniref:Phosphotyrosine protein phosphatase I domain-containing protein n=1 Tax=Ceratopteris richardii TaxID=49495 RepID=A0A8T2R6K3_CERRI|nr:hypothetical protein KP509_29G022500 [Ceratopteris richardii]